MRLPTFVTAALWVALLWPVLTSGAPVEIVPAGFEGAQQPQVALAGNGDVYVTFGSGADIFVARSRTSGRSFEAPVRVGSLPKLALGMRRGPRIAVNGEQVTVTAISHESGDLFGFHSADGGRTWLAPMRINDVAKSATEGLNELAKGPDGRLFVAWLDLRAGKMEVYGAESVDSGKTWSANSLVYRSPEKSVCECCHPSVAYNAAGDVAVMFRKSLAGDRDLWVTARTTGQKVFGPARKVGEGNWRLAACPMDGGALVPLETGSFASVWRRDKEVFLTLPDGKEHKLGVGVQPFGFATAGTVHAFWQAGEDLVRVAGHGGSPPTIVAPKARFGDGVVLPQGAGILVVFEAAVGTRKSIYADVVH